MICASADAQIHLKPLHGTPAATPEVSARSEAAASPIVELAQLRKALALSPLDPSALMQLGLLYGRMGDFPEAAKVFETLTAHAPAWPGAQRALGEALLADSGETPQLTAAEAALRTATVQDTNDVQAWHELGMVLLEEQHPGEAELPLQRAVAEAPECSACRLDLGRALEAKGESAAAQAAYARAQDENAACPAVETGLGRLKVNAAKYQDAIPYLKEALACDPDLEEPHYLLARALQGLHRSGAALEFQEAQDLLRAAEAARRSVRLSNQSLDLARSGDLKAALATATEAVLLAPDNGAAVVNLGLLLADNGQWAAARRTLRKGLSLSPLQTRILIDMARIDLKMHDATAAARAHAVAAGDLQQAEGADMPFGAIAGTAAAHAAFARLLASEGDQVGATGEWLRVLKVNPADHGARVALAQSLLARGQGGEAALELERSGVLAPADGRLLARAQGTAPH